MISGIIHLTNIDMLKRRNQKVIGSLLKPKQVAKGGHGIRQYFKIDETKLTAKKHLGKNLHEHEYSL